MRHQIGVLSPVASAFLIPDNHIGRATVSSVAVAHEVQAMGGRSIACLNARDRNLLGFRRDLLTAAAYGVDEFLFVYGDEPSAGARTSELTVRTMMAEGRKYAERWQPGPTMRFGAATGLRALPEWKRGADFPLRPDRVLPRRPVALALAGGPVDPRVCGGHRPAERRHGAPVGQRHPRSRGAGRTIGRLEQDRNAGVDAACDLVERIRESGALDGVHLIPVTRYREVAARLERARPGRRPD